jgi:hypothetical protein
MSLHVSLLNIKLNCLFKRCAVTVSLAPWYKSARRSIGDGETYKLYGISTVVVIIENLGREITKALAFIESKFPLQTVLTACLASHFKVTLPHHNMALAWVADGEDGIQVWRIDVNVLNKQSWIADKG